MLEGRLICVTAAKPEEQWKQMKTLLRETTAAVVGLSCQKQQDWFDEADKEFRELLEKKCSSHYRLLAEPNDQAAKAAYKSACGTLQVKLRTLRNDCWATPAERPQRHVDTDDMHAFCDALQAVCDRSRLIQAPLRSSDEQRSHPPALVKAFRRPLQLPAHCAVVS